MAILAETSDYTDRTVDVSILQYPEALAVGTQVMTPSFGNPSNLCAGPQKLIQRYTILMLTNVGSQPEYPEFAADFLWRLQAGIGPTDTIRARQIFTLADFDVVNIIKRYQITNPNLPLDEQLANTKLVNLKLANSYVGFDVLLTTLAGSSVNFLVPLPK
jgi:hypothetical protein